MGYKLGLSRRICKPLKLCQQSIDPGPDRLPLGLVPALRLNRSLKLLFQLFDSASEVRVFGFEGLANLYKLPDPLFNVVKLIPYRFFFQRHTSPV